MDYARFLTRLYRSRTNVRFSDFERLVLWVGFGLVRQTGSHRIYQHTRVAEARLNLQPVKGEVKPYQVKQFLALVEEYNLIDEDSSGTQG